MNAWTSLTLPRRAPARVLACGAFLKNTAALVDGAQAWLSPLHGDLSTPDACRALDRSLQALVARAGGRIEAVAHDLHPDFPSTRAALTWAHRLGVPAIALQHHHAHVGVVQAEQGWTGDEPVLAWTLDGVGLGSDGLAWGGELLAVRGGRFERIAHLPLLALPGGDVAAREPWRLAAAVLHALGRADRIEPRFAVQVGAPLARGVRQMLQRDLNCPRTSSAGRWFDAAAGVLGLSLRQSQEAEAAIALERAASAWLAAGGRVDAEAPTLDLLPLLGTLLDEPDAGRGAARFHLALGRGLVAALVDAARDRHPMRAGRVAGTGRPDDADGVVRAVLAGGCFFNRLLSDEVAQGLRAAGLAVHRPVAVGCGDAGLALGQAWVAALQLAAGDASPDDPDRCLSPLALEEH